MLNAESFVWHLEGKLNVKALGHTVKDLDLSKDVTINGKQPLVTLILSFRLDILSVAIPTLNALCTLILHSSIPWPDWN